MKELMMSKLEQILDEQIFYFQRDIAKLCREDSRKVCPLESDFPILNPAGKEFYRYKHFEGMLERYIRDNLTSTLFVRWFKSIGVSAILLENNKNVARLVCSNTTNEKRNPILFTVQEGKKRIGYRFTIPEVDERQIRKWKRLYKIDDIVVIDWAKNTGVEDIVSRISVEEFITNYFSQEVYDLYLDKVKKAIEDANKEIGFHTVSNLSLRNLSFFKMKVEKSLLQFDIRNEQYQEFDDNGNLTGQTYDLLLDIDCDILVQNCFGSGLYRALIGKEKFARCFLTSEYLYQVFEKGDEKYFDYSTIVSGYFKAVELLLEKIMRSTFRMIDHEKLWIKCCINHEKDENHKPMKGGGHVRFKKDLENEFSTEMGPLIYFLEYNRQGWYISDVNNSLTTGKCGKQKVLSCLKNYNSGCRNGHLHKHIIDDVETVKAVRSNTILCLLYLLGACKIFGLSDGSTDMGIENNSYEKLYRELAKMPRSIKKYCLEYESEEIKAIRLLEQDTSQYDERGNLTTSIRFVKADKFSVNEDYLSDEQVICISRDNMPESVYWINLKNEKVKIDFS